MFSRLVTLVSASVEAKTRFEWGNGGVVVAGCACMNYISETNYNYGHGTQKYSFYLLQRIFLCTWTRFKSAPHPSEVQ